jgi:hypothetical protein
MLWAGNAFLVLALDFTHAEIVQTSTWLLSCGQRAQMYTSRHHLWLTISLTIRLLLGRCELGVRVNPLHPSWNHCVVYTLHILWWPTLCTTSFQLPPFAKVPCTSCVHLSLQNNSFTEGLFNGAFLTSCVLQDAGSNSEVRCIAAG